MNAFLSQIEIKELTNRVHRKSQRAVLNALGIACKIRPDGSLVVARAVVEKELGVTRPKKNDTTIEPNWSAMHA